MTKTTRSLYIDADLHRDLKIEAAKRDMTMSDLAELLLKEGLKKSRQVREA